MFEYIIYKPNIIHNPQKECKQTNELKIELNVDSHTDDIKIDCKETDNDEFKEWDNLDNGFSRNLIVALSKQKIAAVKRAAVKSASSSVSAPCGIIPSALNTTTTVTKDVTTTTMKTVLQRHDVTKWGFFHHHYYTTTHVPVTTTQQVTSVVPIAKGTIIGHAAIGAGIASAAMFSLQLGWDFFQYKKSNISKEQLKMRIIKSVTTNGSALAGSITGTAIGTAFAPGVGTAIGAIIGSIVGALASWQANQKWDEYFQQKYPDEFKNVCLKYSFNILNKLIYYHV